ncbi:MAG: adenosylcobinamide-GDP ribazoletransferase [Candidatus Methanomethylophilaceae archaeon]|nr:adenosylcobinamide-GDP ribazoletransferase [Candidatus Methanomethylophilaceae archaeon]
MSALRALVSFYTIFHMNITQEDMDDMETRFHLTPLVGLIFGFLVMLVTIALMALSDNLDFGNGMVTAVLVLLTVYAGSKFLHFDGLTDFGDGMIVSGQQSDHIRALKDTLVGAGGIGVALITVLCSVAFYSMYDNRPLMVLAFPAVEVFVKNAMVIAASMGKPGNGMAARQVERTTSRSAVLGFIVSIIALAILLSVGGLFLNMYSGIEWCDLFVPMIVIVIVGMVVSTIIGMVMARTANRVFGMVNGDILGATNEVSRPFLVFFILLFVEIYLTVI